MADGTPVDVTFRVRLSPESRSSLSVGEETVTDINIAAFRNGRVTAALHSAVDGGMTMQFLKGGSYNIYALANVGALSIPSREEDFLAYACSIDDIDDLNGGFPMCWKLEGFTAGVLEHPVDIELERLVAKVRLAMMTPDMEGFRVTSVRLCQAASTVRPFAAGGSRALSGETLDGDYASEADLTTLNNGGSICFYTFENCQGTLLEGNNDPWDKVPDKIVGKADVCTYIEIACEHDGSSLLEGTVTYRLYLGADNCSNFDLVRNRDYTLTLITTYGGMSNGLSWKVDVDAGISNGAEGGVGIGMHDIDDLYIGEVVYISFDSADGLEDFIGGELHGEELVLVKDGVVSDAALFGRIDGDCSGKREYGCEMHCTDEISGGDIYIKSGGRLVARIAFTGDRKVNIKKPELHLSDDGAVPADGWHTPQAEILPVINGPSPAVYLYLTDDVGRNLLSPEQYGFDNGLFQDDMSVQLLYNSRMSVPGLPAVYDRAVKASGYDVSYIFADTGDTGVPFATAYLSLLTPESEYNTATGSLAVFWRNVLRYAGEQAPSPLRFVFSSGKTASPAGVLSGAQMLSPTVSWDAVGHSFSIVNRSYVDFDCEIFISGPARSAGSGELQMMKRVEVEGYCSDPLFFDRVSVHSAERNAFTADTRDRDGSVVRSQTYRTLPAATDTYYVVISIGGRAFPHSFIPDTGGCRAIYYTGYDSAPQAIVPGVTRGNSFITETYRDYRDNRTGREMTKVRTQDNITLRDVLNLLDETAVTPITTTLSYSAGGVVTGSTVNPYSERFVIGIGSGQIKGTCTHRNFSTQNWTTDSHTMYLPYNDINVHYPAVGTTATDAEAFNYHFPADRNFLSSDDIATAFGNLNLANWHNSSDKAVAAKGNRHSRFTLPSSLTVDVYAMAQDRFVPVILTVPSSTISATVPGPLYTKSGDGTYWNDGRGETNADGSSRDRKEIGGNVTARSGFIAASTSQTAFDLKLNYTRPVFVYYKGTSIKGGTEEEWEGGEHVVIE